MKFKEILETNPENIVRRVEVFNYGVGISASLEGMANLIHGQDASTQLVVLGLSGAAKIVIYVYDRIHKQRTSPVEPPMSQEAPGL